MTDYSKPETVNLKDIDWVPQGLIARLADHGITNSEQLLSEGINLDGFRILADQTGIDLEMINDLGRLVGLCRVQWVSLTFARLLLEAGYDDCRQLASAEASILFADVDRVNKEKGYFKGKIGLRDIKRLIHAAGYAL